MKEGNSLLRVTHMLDIVSALPADHFNLLRFLCQFLALVHENARKNKMSIDNLSLLFAPILFVAKEGDTDQMLNSVRIAAEVVKILVLNHDRFALKVKARRFSLSRSQ